MATTDDTTQFVIDRYNRNALWYDSMDRMVSAGWRTAVTSQARGRVLEVGVGTGKNLPFYDPSVTSELTGIDFSRGMLALTRLKPCAVPLKILTMDAQAMKFRTASFDTVVATCVFCTVPDPITGLREARRVCRPGGRVLLLEHVRSERPFVGWVMDLLDPLVVRAIGTHINRRTVQNVEMAGLRINRVTDLRSDILKLIEAQP